MPAKNETPALQTEERPPPLRQSEILRTMLAVLLERAKGSESHSVELSRNAKGDTQMSIKVYNSDPAEAARIAAELYSNLRVQFPLNSGAVGA